MLALRSLLKSWHQNANMGSLKSLILNIPFQMVTESEFDYRKNKRHVDEVQFLRQKQKQKQK